jgi:tRNA modification GTPase
MRFASDIIIAPLTPAGHSAIAVLRISGKGCTELAAKYFRPASKLLNSPSHRLIHGFVHDGQEQDIDEVLISVFKAPHSYSGEESLEISCHGNPNLTNRILKTFLQNCRLAEPGEFTLRAYLNGKLDLSQAEAVNDLIQAQVSKAEHAALLQLKGMLSEHLQGILQQITQARLRCELAIDFADQDLPQIDLDALRNQINITLDNAEELAAKSEQGRVIREGIKVCLAGAPNAGKSSLFNALLQQNRAIVTPHPGTTRDYLEESISLNGFPLVIYDTAGLRISSDEIEIQGIEKSYELMQDADLIIYLKEARPEQTPSINLEETTIAQELWHKTLLVVSKSDLLGSVYETANDLIHCNTVTTKGLEQLTASILSRLNLSDELVNKPLITNSRHLAALEKAIAALKQALQSLDDGLGYEFTAFELGAASSALEEILGVITPDDLLERIFSNFCIGK